MEEPRTTMSIDLMADLAEHERNAVAELRDAVYPPAEEADWSGADVEWSPARWRVGIWSGDGELATHVGLLLRAGTLDGKDVTIAGVGGVKTHPRHRRFGHAQRALRAAGEFLRARGDVDFGLLVCEPPLLGYYSGLGWREFTGRLLVTQYGEPTVFTASPHVMTLPVLGPAPADGVIDLGGPPW
ncbi:GNAT family N-acetyltransferase [Streptomyces sp. B21-083]|uniref:GNAT family N-acetyltransferase n=1 Tax=Streptomyces sp. B21-083 TaxID=3039410 RepID=UPI002FEEC46A